MATSRPDNGWSGTTATVPASVLLQDIDDEAVLLDTSSETYFELNAMGAWVVRRIDGQRTFDELVDAVVAEFDVGEAVARADVGTLLDSLIGHGLVTVG